MKDYNFYNSKHYKRIYLDDLNKAHSMIQVLLSSCAVLTDESGNLVQLYDIEDVTIYIEFKAKSKTLKKNNAPIKRIVI